MILEAIYHLVDVPYVFPISKNKLKVRIRAKKGDLAKCGVLYQERYYYPQKNRSVLLKKVAVDELYDYFEGELLCDQKYRVNYMFNLVGKSGEEIWYGQHGFRNNIEHAGMFEYPFIEEADIFYTPEWAHNAIVYQIFVDRFYNGNTANNPENVAEWGSIPESDTCYGGDLAGIIEKLPYIESLGVNVIYLTPIFSSPSYHKYDTKDYLTIDSNFGDLNTFKELVNKAHELGIRVVLDVAFNHCGIDFFAFQDVLKNGEASMYVDWFHINSFPIVQLPQPSYDTFHNMYYMPKLNSSNPELRKYILDMACYWMEETKIDGWRLDFANDIAHDFWREFRKVVKKVNKDVLLIGEIWNEAGSFLRGDQLDGVTNYKIGFSTAAFLGNGTLRADGYMNMLAGNLMYYPDQANFCMYNFISSHDLARFASMCSGSDAWEINNYFLQRFQLAILIQMTYPGIPLIYYGDEVGMEGAGLQDCRRCMVWNEDEQNHDILNFYKKMISIRKSKLALQKGQFIPWIADELNNVLGYLRCETNQVLAIIMNNNIDEKTVEVKVDWKNEGETLTDIMTGEKYKVSAKMSLNLKPFEFMILE